VHLIYFAWSNWVMVLPFLIWDFCNFCIAFYLGSELCNCMVLCTRNDQTTDIHTKKWFFYNAEQCLPDFTAFEYLLYYSMW
jgi:hypothetical protein